MKKRLASALIGAAMLITGVSIAPGQAAARENVPQPITGDCGDGTTIYWWCKDLLGADATVIDSVETDLESRG